MQLIRVGFVLSCIIPALARAQSPFDRTWRVVPGSDKYPAKPDVYLLQAGTYHCPTCNPPIALEADGEGHKITAPCYDTVSLRVVDSRTTEETDKRNGRIVATSKMTVSSGGNTATVESTEMCNANGDVTSGPGREQAKVMRAPPVSGLSRGGLVYP
jgi:hypothetical protein